jgi:glycosyltransferase involved in cell wall biosynthesis
LKLKVGFLPLYRIQYPSSRYRVFQFLAPLEQQGCQCTLIEAPQRNLWKRLAYVPRLFHLALTQDVLYVQKRIFPMFVLRVLRQLNPCIVFDLDDAIYLRSARRPLVDAMLQTAIVVVAGNDCLARYARQFNEQVVIIPSVVDTDGYLPPSGARHPGDSRVVIGWIGSDPNRGDLEPIRPVFDWLGEQCGGRVVLRVVSNRPLEMGTRLHVEFVPWTLEGSRAVLQQFDIGIMPLEDTEWNRGKCGFKLIQYMAVGAPAVASPVGVNREIIRDGTTGYLAMATQEWQDRLMRLIEDETLRCQMGHAARRHVEQCYSVKAILPLLIQVLECASAGCGRGSNQDSST